jgi:hypothetical protein
MPLKTGSAYSYALLNADCLLHFAPCATPRGLTLADGTRVAPGEVVAEAHLWNEHLPRSTGGELATGMARMRGSLQQLAGAVQAHPDLEAVRAIYGEMGLVPETRLPQLRRILNELGFELIPGERPGWNLCRRAFWRNAVSWWYLRKYNASAAQQLRLRQVRRCEVWMSRDQLLARYGQ